MRRSACHMKTNPNPQLYVKELLPLKEKDGSATSRSILLPTPAAGSRHIQICGGRNSSVDNLKQRASMMLEEDYLYDPVKRSVLALVNPKVFIGILLAEIVNEIKMIPGSNFFLTPKYSRFLVSGEAGDDRQEKPPVDEHPTDKEDMDMMKAGGMSLKNFWNIVSISDYDTNSM
uniref:Doublecortin domain-containing protein n=1 Tax=Caenorhabditis tropicalis TaxID=1561998 RepID=A0A1I7TLC3_9PELO